MNNVNQITLDIMRWLIYEEKDIVHHELPMDGTEIRAEWVEKGTETMMYIGFESPLGNMAHREVECWDTPDDIIDAVRAVLEEGYDHYEEVV